MTTIEASISTAIDSACDFLIAGQSPDGLWRDYALPPGASSHWVTAFVGYALAGVASTSARTAALGKALDAVRRAARPSGWGYNESVATDADTTAWVVRWFVRSGAEIPLDPIPCLRAYIGRGGGARTFVAHSKFGRWIEEHSDVTPVLGLAMSAAGAPAATIESLRRSVVDGRNADGVWTPFWWTFASYATARSLELLAETGGVPADISASAHAALERAAPAAHAMEAANLLAMACHAGASPEPWLSRLLDRRAPNGGWPPSRALKIPSQRTEPEPTGAFEDANGFMSTAMALGALSTSRASLHRVERGSSSTMLGRGMGRAVFVGAVEGRSRRRDFLFR